MELTIWEKNFIQINRNNIFNINIPDEKNLISKYIKPLKGDIWRPVGVRLKMDTKISETCTCKRLEIMKL